MGNRYRLALCFLVLLGSGFASAGPIAALTLEDFEGYADSAELVSAWVPASNGTETLGTVTVFEGALAMQVEYNCSLGDFSTVHTYDVVENWTGYTTLSLMYRGAEGNSGERLVVEIRDQWGNFLKGDAVSNATQSLGWMEYTMDISGWANREWVKEVKIWLEADSWGQGTVTFDYLLLPSAISVDPDTWSRIKAFYGSRKRMVGY